MRLEGGALVDPQACYDRWRFARMQGDKEEAAEAWRDLNRWIRNGGFDPDWSPKERDEFRDWDPRT